MRIQVFWDVMLCHWVSGSIVSKDSSAFSFKDQAVQKEQHQISQGKLNWWGKVDFKFLAQGGFLCDNTYITATAFWDTK
jgi:hypothetical protein